MRILGACLILIGCGGLGIRYREELIGRIKAIKMLQTLLTLLESEIDYNQSTLSESCLAVSKRIPGELGHALRAVGLRMEKNYGESFSDVFENLLGDALRSLPLRAEDKSDFFFFVSDDGFTDERVQLRLLKESNKLLGDKAEQLCRERKEKGRMVMGLSVLGGLMLVLMLC